MIIVLIASEYQHLYEVVHYHTCKVQDTPFFSARCPAARPLSDASLTNISISGCPMLAAPATREQTIMLTGLGEAFDPVERRIMFSSYVHKPGAMEHDETNRDFARALMPEACHDLTKRRRLFGGRVAGERPSQQARRPH